MQVGLRELLRGTSVLGSARLVEFVLGFVRIKVCALLLGVEGLGVFNQANLLSQKLIVFTTLSTNEGFVKQLAESADKDNARELILSSLKGYLLVITIYMSISILLLTVFSEKIALYIFGDARYFYAFWFCLSSLPLLIANSVPYSLMRAFQDVSSIAKVRVLSSFVNILHVVPLIYFYNIEGAIVSVLLFHLVTVFFQYIYSRKIYFKRFDITFRSILAAKKNSKFIKELIHFSGFGATIGIYVVVSEFICRSIVVKQLGVEAIGLYSPVIMWATLFTGFLLPALTTYLFSSLCKTQKNDEISLLLNNGLRLSSIALMPLLFMAIPYRDVIISIFYSDSFIEAAKYLPFHLLGVVFHVWFSVLGRSMASTGRIKQHGVLRLLFLTADIIVTYFGVAYWGLWGWMAKHIVSPVIFYFVYHFYCRKYMEFMLSRSNFILMVYILICSLLLVFFDMNLESGPIINYILGPTLLLSSVFILTKREKEVVMKNLLARLKRS